MIELYKMVTGKYYKDASTKFNLLVTKAPKLELINLKYLRNMLQAT